MSNAADVCRCLNSIIYYLVSVDWRSCVEPEPRRKKSTSDDSAKREMYEKMKKNLQYIDLDAELIDYDTYEIGNNIMKSTQNLHSIIKKLIK